MRDWGGADEGGKKVYNYQMFIKIIIKCL